MRLHSTVVPVFISVFSSTEIFGMHRCEIGIVQTQIVEQIFTNTIAADANFNTWRKYVKHIGEGEVIKWHSILLTFISWRVFDLFGFF